jgi:hypothetical protein
MKKLSLLSVIALLSIIIPVVNFSPANAAACSDPSKDGKTIGKIVVGSTSVDVKNINYPAGGELDPPKSPLVAGVSLRHKQLSSLDGTSLIVWHINYDGCQGKLDVINNKPKGFLFTIVDETGKSRKYKIDTKTVVVKGTYKPEWFRLNGPRQLVFVTCTGKVVKGSYTDNLVITAIPA